VAVWGAIRLTVSPEQRTAGTRFCCLQPNLDHLNRGENSLEESFTVARSLVYGAAKHEPACMVLPESSLLTFLARRPSRMARVRAWIDSVRTPLILGSLHWDKGREGSPYEYLVYNTAFMATPGDAQPRAYFKMKLVPFSEALPFEGVFPLLSRVNLGEADFKRGTEPVIFSVGDSIAAVPLICYEVIYPAFVRSRAVDSANVLVNITNDGWFGRSPGPFHHAQMARMRCIENGISLVRAANTGISMLVDPFGRIRGRTRLSERTVLCGEVPLARIATAYSRWGDWVVLLSGMIMLAAAVFGLVRPSSRTASSQPARQSTRRREPSRTS
jgi:apolipoprotein N-acyltransferase